MLPTTLVSPETRSAPCAVCGARHSNTALCDACADNQVFLDVVTTRRRLTPTDSMRLVWIAGPSMPAGGAT